MNLTINDLPPRLHRKLRAQSEANKRSLNWEVIHILEQALESQRVDVDSLLVDIEKLRSRIKGPPLTEELLQKAKNQGRP